MSFESPKNISFPDPFKMLAFSLSSENAGLSEGETRGGILPECPGANADLQVLRGVFYFSSLFSILLMIFLPTVWNLRFSRLNESLQTG